MLDDTTTVEHPADLDVVRRQVDEMLAEGRGNEAVRVLFTIIQAMLRENNGLSLRVAALMKQIYGRRSEKVDPDQLRLFLEALDENPSAGEVLAELPLPSDEPLPKAQTKAALAAPTTTTDQRPPERPLAATTLASATRISSNTSFADTWTAASWPVASSACGVPRAGSSVWWRSPARDACAPHAGHVAQATRPQAWSTRSCPRPPTGSGC